MLNIFMRDSSTAYESYKSLDKIGIVNFGSSHGMTSFIYRENLNGLNLGLPGQRLYSDLVLANSIYENLDESAVLIFPISVFSFCGEFDFRQGNILTYVDFLNHNDLAMSWSEYIITKFFPYVGVSNNERNLVWNKSEFIKPFLDNSHEREEFLRQLAAECYGYYEIKVVEEFKLFTRRAIEDGHKIVIIIPPYHRSYWELLSQEAILMKTIYKLIDSIKLDNDKLIYIDYSNDDRFTNNSNLFIDTDHLNEYGRELFTNIIISDINSMHAELDIIVD